MAKANSTTIRVRKDITEDLSTIKEEAQNGASIAELAEEILRQAIAQIRGQEPLGALRMVSTLRGQITHGAGDRAIAPDLAERVLQLEKKLEERDRASHGVNEEPPRVTMNYDDLIESLAAEVLRRLKPEKGQATKRTAA